MEPTGAELRVIVASRLATSPKSQENFSCSNLIGNSSLTPITSLAEDFCFPAIIVPGSYNVFIGPANNIANANKKRISF